MTGKRAIRQWLRTVRQHRFAAEERGIAAVEFALVLPIFVLLLLGCFEVPRYVLVYQKITRTSSSVADLVAQADEAITYGQLQDIFIAGAMSMQPYDVVTNGEIIVSSINNPGGAGAKITWQRKKGSVTTTSRIGNQGSVPALPAGLTPASDKEVLVAEVFFNYTPIFSTLIYEGSELYSVSYSRPRNNNLMTPPPTTAP